MKTARVFAAGAYVYCSNPDCPDADGIPNPVDGSLIWTDKLSRFIVCPSCGTRMKMPAKLEWGGDWEF